jgi:beta-lactamase regulating signal transducer with metallopeptidase domain
LSRKFFLGIDDFISKMLRANRHQWKDIGLHLSQSINHFIIILWIIILYHLIFTTIVKNAATTRKMSSTRSKALDEHSILISKATASYAFTIQLKFSS